MTIRNLDRLLQPRSIAVVGASARPGSVGNVILTNIIGGMFPGAIYAINPKRIEVAGATWTASVGDLPAAPDLAIIATPPSTVPEVISQLGSLGTKTAVVVTAGITCASGLRQAMLEAAAPHLLRVIGPNCIGTLMPRAHLNASFSRAAATPGRLALISQSGALVTAILDWAQGRGVGFSGVVSAGDMADVDLGDLLELFAADPGTDAILMYIEGVTNPAKFMSAARAAARIKPVIAVKGGRTAAASKATLSHTGALAGSYETYKEAFRRAGIVMVDNLTELFDAAEVLCKGHARVGNRLAIVTNGGGAGILAVDALDGSGAVPAVLSDPTRGALDTVLPDGWSHGNPVDLMGDAHADRYRSAVDLLLRDEGADALLVMNCPTALSSPTEIAEAVASQIAQARRAGIHKPVLACWLGDANCAAAQAAFRAAGVPLFATPDNAIRGLGYLIASRNGREALIGSPGAKRAIPGDRKTARALIDAARADNRTMLDEIESKALLAAYGIPVVPTKFVPSVDEVAAACGTLAAPYAVKLVSHQIGHKSDVGGVALDLPDADAAVAAAGAIADRISRDHPNVVVRGFAVETMWRRPHAHELLAGIADDAAFGPLIVVGAGGKAVEIVRDKALELAPLDAVLARNMVARTRVFDLLKGYRDEPAADVVGVATVLEALSAIAVDLPDVLELDINPLLVDVSGTMALDARVRITDTYDPPSRLVIRPIPMEWAADLVTRSGFRFHVRPVFPDDEAALEEFFAHVTLDDLRFRFLTGLTKVDRARIAAMTQIDYRRTMTFLAFGADGTTVVAVAMLAADPDRVRAEVALSVRSDHKQRGLSWTLLKHVLSYAQAEGIETVESIESGENVAAINLEREMGFTTTLREGDLSEVVVRKSLTSL